MPPYLTGISITEKIFGEALPTKSLTGRDKTNNFHVFYLGGEKWIVTEKD
jgi:hypothetical protein